MRGRARNAICTGKYSNQVEIMTEKCANKEPPSVNEVKVRVEEKSCSVHYQWNVTNHNSITVTFEDRDGN